MSGLLLESGATSNGFRTLADVAGTTSNGFRTLADVVGTTSKGFRSLNSRKLEKLLVFCSVCTTFAP